MEQLPKSDLQGLTGMECSEIGFLQDERRLAHFQVAPL